jgi:hypothetical protein
LLAKKAQLISTGERTSKLLRATKRNTSLLPRQQIWSRERMTKLKKLAQRTLELKGTQMTTLTMKEILMKTLHDTVELLEGNRGGRFHQDIFVDDGKCLPPATQKDVADPK